MICVALSETNLNKCIELVQQFELSEIRIDLCKFNAVQVKEIFSNGGKLIATCRPNPLTDNERKELLITAIQNGASYVDVEIESDYAFKQAIITEARKNNCTVIISYHNYENTPSAKQLQIIAQQCFDMGADVAKMACLCNVPEDNASILSVYQPNKRIVSIGMGEMGKISRIAAIYMGAEFTFAAVSNQQVTAPGQISYDKLSNIVNLINN